MKKPQFCIDESKPSHWLEVQGDLATQFGWRNGIKQIERPCPAITANREVAHLGLSTNRIARYQHTALNHLQRLFPSDDCVISCLLPATPSILLSTNQIASG
ncbi:hypothetical protein TNIN_266801 [Trichonephila inaurata madagascariensis]|uniref:Uncharacterized protein n=1 Tax=Trichonephila inaurata madagascariensis TaxID=2747483 RepID=A0A8X6XV31_9ARAC|nr:hypothetical protein TNIN_266801 [Trichonephila inaurata madagascariensis]